MTGTVTLELHDADSVRVLCASLASTVRICRASAEYHDATGRIRAGAGEAAEGKRHKRAAAEFTRRQGLAQQLLDQLPTDPKESTP